MERKTKQGVPDLNFLGPRKPPKRRIDLTPLLCKHKWKCQNNGLDACSRCEIEVPCTHPDWKTTHPANDQGE